MSDEHGRITRRELLVGGAAVAVGGLAPAEAADAPVPQVPRRQLGRTGKAIPILLMGGGAGFDPRFDPRLAEALRVGVDYVDAADCYAGGRCEPAVGTFHQRAKARARMWITTKSDRHDPAGFEQTVRASLGHLQTDYVDMYYLHALTDASRLGRDLAATVDRLKKGGQIRHFGFSCHGPNVPELLRKAAETPWVESVMFRYNFREYGNRELNAAMDAAHRAGVGLIAMKTQGSELRSPDAAQRFEQTGRWNRHQAVLKAVWADPRISAAVSHMDTFEKLRENVAAAVDRAGLTDAEQGALRRYAEDTGPLACRGCDHLCGPAVAAPVRIGDTLRMLMYHDAYGEKEEARTGFAALPEAARRIAGVDFAPANAACPFGVDVARHMQRAATVLA